MNFFEHQDQARRMTTRLILLFIATVIALVAGLYGVVILLVTSGEFDVGSYWRPELLFFIASATITVVGLGTGYKLMALSASGGAGIAERLGGRRVDPATSDFAERRLLNVVEEMSIASSVPTPTVYILEEPSINAFAAGTRPETAVIGVTRGCINLLTRDQLQGVIAHEFSHILNGDMRLNLRLIGVLHGILILSYLGQGLVRSLFYSSMLGGRRRRGKGEVNGAGVLVIGLALMVLGWVGVFFGSLIKAAVSRQREFLADASAVQFTRNPDGIAGALKAIGAHSEGSRVSAPNAVEASHMFFGQGVQSFFGAPFATHPPLRERIQRIDPSWNGEFGVPPSIHRDDAIPRRSRMGDSIESLKALDQSIGQPSPSQIAGATALVTALPPQVREGVRHPDTARAIVLGLLVHDSVLDKQRAFLQQYAEAGVQREFDRILPTLSKLDQDQRLPLINLAVPALKTLSFQQYGVFKQCIMGMVAADQKLSLFEWVVMELVRHHLRPSFEGESGVLRRRRRTRENCFAEYQLLLSAIVHYGVRQEYHEQASDLADIPLLPWARDWDALDKAIETLQDLEPSAKLQLLQTCANCILVDKHVPIEAAELLRAVSELLDCPMPSLAFSE